LSAFIRLRWIWFGVLIAALDFPYRRNIGRRQRANSGRSVASQPRKTVRRKRRPAGLGPPAAAMATHSSSQDPAHKTLLARRQGVHAVAYGGCAQVVLPGPKEKASRITLFPHSGRPRRFFAGNAGSEFRHPGTWPPALVWLALSATPPSRSPKVSAAWKREMQTGTLSSRDRVAAIRAMRHAHLVLARNDFSMTPGWGACRFSRGRDSWVLFRSPGGE